QGGYPPPQPPPPPQSGGYPPPPPPQGGGYPPPPPQAGGYPPPAPGYGAPAYSVGDAFSWAWNKFSKNAGPLIVATLVLGAIVGIIYGITYGLALAVAPAPQTTYYSGDNGMSASYSSGFGAFSILVLIIGYIVLLVAAAVIQSAYLSGLLDIANGRQVTFGDFFKPRNVGQVIIAAVLVGILTGIGTALCFIPGIIVGFLLMFTIVALLDHNLSPTDALKASFDVVKNNVGNAILAYLVMAAIVIVGALVCFVGLIVAVPVEMLFMVYTWRKLSGGQVAPLTP